MENKQNNPAMVAGYSRAFTVDYGEEVQKTSTAWTSIVMTASLQVTRRTLDPVDRKVPALREDRARNHTVDASRDNRIIPEAG